MVVNDSSLTSFRTKPITYDSYNLSYNSGGYQVSGRRHQIVTIDLRQDHVIVTEIRVVFIVK
uniref:Uncharacterized protein n=1 Tax=Rhizophagus irregularis (strain DAOM 181602 / DAOM 197198 / MUCL 43194) TaxID=747089 RepID=U9V6C9_RHIID